jgi:hypothetical protein
MTDWTGLALDSTADRVLVAAGRRGLLSFEAPLSSTSKPEVLSFEVLSFAKPGVLEKLTAWASRLRSSRKAEDPGNVRSCIDVTVLPEVGALALVRRGDETTVAVLAFSERRYAVAEGHALPGPYDAFVH